MSASFTNQVLAQIELFTKDEEYQPGVYILPKHLDEKVARLHLDRIGVKLSKLDADQALMARSSQNTIATNRLVHGIEKAPRRNAGAFLMNLIS